MNRLLSRILLLSITHMIFQPAYADEMKNTTRSIDRTRRISFRFSWRDHPFFTYQGSEVQPPEGMDPIYARSGFIHPLRSPSGLVLTEAFPPDHAHPAWSLFSAWTRAKN